MKNINNNNGLTNLKSNFVLILVSIVVGIIISIVAQLFILTAKLVFKTLRNSELFNNDFIINLNTYTPLIACILASLAVCILIKVFNITRWHGPADTIYAAHQKVGALDVKSGFLSTFATFFSVCGGASVGIYGPLVHFGGTLGVFLRRLQFIPNIPHDIIIGAGVAAAISAGFNAPIAGIVFAHEVVLRHFSTKAVTAIALSSISAFFTASEMKLVSSELIFTEQSFVFITAAPGLLIIGILSSLIAFLFMKSLLLTNKLSQSINIKNYYKPIIPGLLCGIAAIFFPETIGLGSETIVNLTAQNFTFLFLISLIFIKIFLTSFCIGFGLFGGIFSPALLIGASVGAIVFNIPHIGIDNSLLAVFVVSGMAALSSSVIGAPISAIILILELTGSYQYAIASIVSIGLSNLIILFIFGSSFFDVQLLQRGINIGDGRENILMQETKIISYCENQFTKFNINIMAKEAIEVFKKDQTTEGYFIDENQHYIGKVKLIDLLDKKKKAFEYCEKKPIILDLNNNILDSINILKSFVGESIPVIDKNTNKMCGIISENDVLTAYSDISKQIKAIEKN